MACGSDSVSNSDNARRAYLGLDAAIDKALNLGMKGYNDASSANIPTEMTTGDVMGTLTVTGQVDQGASSNKEMRLITAFVGYEDRVLVGDAPTPTGIVYDAAAGSAADLNLSLRNIPSGTFTGTLNRAVHMTGDLKGDVTLMLTFSGNLQPVAGMAGKIQRMPGSTHITGTATSDYGTFTVDITR
jgi:hypothetical protein